MQLVIHCCMGGVCLKYGMMNAEFRIKRIRGLFAFIGVIRGKAFTKIAQTVEHCPTRFAQIVERGRKLVVDTRCSGIKNAACFPRASDLAKIAKTAEQGIFYRGFRIGESGSLGFTTAYQRPSRSEQ